MTLVTYADVNRGSGLNFAAKLPRVVERTLAGRPAPEHLPVGLPEVLRQEGVNDGVDGGVAVGQAVGHHPEHEGGLVEREGAELHPQVDDVVGQPGQTEDHDHHEDRLGRLDGQSEGEDDGVKNKSTYNGILLYKRPQPYNTLYKTLN